MKADGCLDQFILQYNFKRELLFLELSHSYESLMLPLWQHTLAFKSKFRVSFSLFHHLIFFFSFLFSLIIANFFYRNIYFFLVISISFSKFYYFIEIRIVCLRRYFDYFLDMFRTILLLLYSCLCKSMFSLS